MHRYSQSIQEHTPNCSVVPSFTDYRQLKYTYINIDSSKRRTIANIVPSSVRTLEHDSVRISKDSNELIISLYNHMLTAGTRIRLTNISLPTYKLKNACEFIPNSNRLWIYYTHNYTTDDTANSSIYVNISNFGNTGYINNIPTVVINKQHRIHVDNNNRSKFYIELPYVFTGTFNTADANFIFTIQFQSISGIHLTSINNITDQYHTVHNIIDSDVFSIKLNEHALYSSKEVVKYGQLGIIKQIIPGYDTISDIVIPLPRRYNNVVGCQIVNSEFPITEYIINYNNEVTWYTIDTGNVLQKTHITPGIYTLDALLSAIETSMSTNVIKYKLTANKSTSVVSISAMKTYIVPNCITAVSPVGDGYELTITHVDHRRNTNDIIRIDNSLDVDNISSELINAEHVITVIDNDTYTLTIPNVNSIMYNSSQGGNSISLSYPYIFKLDNTHDKCILSLLGWRDIGISTSYTTYDTMHVNSDPYELEINNNATYTNNLINLNGTRYVTIHSTRLIQYDDQLLEKILLNNNVGDIVHNNHSGILHKFDKPLVNLDEIDLRVYNNRGEPYDFNGYDYSLTIKLYIMCM